eukprot:gene5543-5779_t
MHPEDEQRVPNEWFHPDWQQQRTTRFQYEDEEEDEEKDSWIDSRDDDSDRSSEGSEPVQDVRLDEDEQYNLEVFWARSERKVNLKVYLEYLLRTRVMEDEARTNYKAIMESQKPWKSAFVMRLAMKKTESWLMGWRDNVSKLVSEVYAARRAVQGQAGWSDRDVEEQTVKELTQQLYTPGFEHVVAEFRWWTTRDLFGSASLVQDSYLTTAVLTI